MPEPEHIDRRRVALIAYDVCRRALTPSDSARRAAMRPVLDACQVPLVGKADQAGHPIDTVFGRARKIAKPGMRAHHHQQVGEAVHQDAEKGLRSIVPLVL